MDTSVDNTNNTTNNTNITTNNTIDLFDVFQKPAPLPEFKSNGTTDNSAIDMYIFDKPPTNGKRPADDDFDDDDEEDDDFGPETDVDAVDDVLLSPTIAAAKALVEGNGNNSPMDVVDKMDTLDVDMELQRQQTSEFEPMRECREETPTPPADSVLDNSGLADNVAESGDDSEDEWNYYKVDPKQKENSANHTSETTNNKDLCDNHALDLESEEMSQLNPDAKEFVPISPTKTSPVSPVPNFNAIIDDVIAQSPRRGATGSSTVPMDINVPSPVDFYKEVKSRPSEVMDDDQEVIECQNQNGNQSLSSQEIMQNLLNGKDPSEIEFHPITPNDADDVEDTENNKENIQHGEKTEPDFSTAFYREQDPMSMSFYQDKDDATNPDGFSTNPFDLNQVQLIPDNIEDIVEPSAPAPSLPQEDDDAAKQEQHDVNLFAPPSSKSPMQETMTASSPLHQQQTVDEFIGSSVSPLPQTVPVVSQSPFGGNDVVVDDEDDGIHELPKTPEPVVEQQEQQQQQIVCESPVFGDSNKSPIQVEIDDVPKPSSTTGLLGSQSPTVDFVELNSPAGPLSPKSPIPELTGLVSPDITASIKDENVSTAEISETPKSPLDEGIPKSPDDVDVITGPGDDEQQFTKSPCTLDGIESSPIAVDVDVIVAAADAAVPIESPASQFVAEAISESPVIQHMENTVQSAVNNLFDSSDAFVCEFEQQQQQQPPAQEVIENVQQLITEAIQDVEQIQHQVEQQQQEQQQQQDLFEPIVSAVEEKQFDEVVFNTSTVESIAPSEVMNDFLERSNLPDVTSPLNSTIDQQQQQQQPPLLDDANELWSNNQQQQQSQPEQHIDIVTLHETIQPEFPVHTIASPSEESKCNDTPPPTPSAVVDDVPTLKRGSPEPEQIVEAVEKLTELPQPVQEQPPQQQQQQQQPVEESQQTAVTAEIPAVAVVAAAAATATAAAAAATTAAVTKTSTTAITKAKPGTTIKKSPAAISKTSPTSPMKPLPSSRSAAAAASPAAKKTAAKTSGTTLKPSTNTLKPKTPPTTARTVSSTTTTARTAGTTPKTRTTPATTPTSAKTADKKPLTNGDVKAKPSTGTVLAKRPSASASTASKTALSTTSRTLSSTTTAAAAGTTRNVSSASARLTNSSATAKPPTAAARTTVPKPRPAGTASTLKSTTSTMAKSSAATKTSTVGGATKPVASTTNTSAAAAKPKTATTTTATTAAGRLKPISARLTSKAAPDTEKQLKDSTNKQISSRTITKTAATAATGNIKPTITTIRKSTDTKARTVNATRTTATTLKSTAGAKKPTETNRTKTTTSTANSKTTPVPVTKPVTAQNGLINNNQLIEQQMTNGNSTVQNGCEDESHLNLVKDNSPIDNTPTGTIVDNSELQPMVIIAD